MSCRKIDIGIKVWTVGKTKWVGGHPSAGFGMIVAAAKVDKTGLRICPLAGKAPRIECIVV